MFIFIDFFFNLKILNRKKKHSEERTPTHSYRVFFRTGDAVSSITSIWFLIAEQTEWGSYPLSGIANSKVMSHFFLFVCIKSN
jgi:hypothetical protein